MKKSLFLFIFLLCELLLSSGQAPFKKVYESTLGYSWTIYKIIETSDNHLLVISDYQSNAFPSIGFLVSKIERNGDPVWSRKFGLTSSYLEFINVVELKDKGYLIAAHGDVRSMWVDSTILFELDTAGNFSALRGIASYEPYLSAFSRSDSTLLMFYSFGSANEIVKYDLHDSILWTKTLHQPVGLSLDHTAILPNDDGSFFISGSDYTHSGLSLIKFDSAGNEMWQSSIFPLDTNTYISSANFININPNKFLFSGILGQNGQNKIIFLLIDSMGNQLKNKTYYMPHIGAYMQAIKGNDEISYLFGFDSPNLISSLVAVDTSLNFLNAFTLSDTVTTEGLVFEMLLTDENEMWFCGGMNDTSHLFTIQKTDSLNNYPCQRYFFNMVEDSVLLIDTSFYFNTTASNIAIGPCVTLVSNNPINIAGFDFCSTTTNVPAGFTNDFSIFPNPAHTFFDIRSSNHLRNAHLEIYNLLGEKIFTAVDYLPATIDCRLFPPGIYFVSIQTDQGTTVQKLIKQ